MFNNQLLGPAVVDEKLMLEITGHRVCFDAVLWELVEIQILNLRDKYNNQLKCGSRLVLLDLIC